MTNSFLKLLLFPLISALLTSCVPIGERSELHFVADPSVRFEELIPDDVTYEFLRRNILIPKQCIRCHQGMRTEAGLLWWIVPGEVEESELFLSMEDGSMPPKRPATTRELEIVRKYIESLGPKKIL